MTRRPSVEENYVQGYWVELQNARILGGVSAARQGWEVGLGVLYAESDLGLTGYLQYELPVFNCRLQMDRLAEQWLPQLNLGIPIPWKQFKLEPHLIWQLDKSAHGKLGLRIQYQF